MAKAKVPVDIHPIGRKNGAKTAKRQCGPFPIGGATINPKPASQKGMIAAKLADMKRGDNQHTKEDASKDATSQTEPASKANASKDASASQADEDASNGASFFASAGNNQKFYTLLL